ncbi:MULTISPECIES: hypothetical protein [Rhizobium]
MSGEAKLASAIPLAAKPSISQGVAVIGHPAFDRRIPDVNLMEDIYGKIYNKKRLAPGAVTAVRDGKLLRNCTTLGGSSGSCVLDFASGEAFGLHFSGRFITTNYAVPADTVRNLLAKALSPGAAKRRVRRDIRAEVFQGSQDTSSTPASYVPRATKWARKPPYCRRRRLFSEVLPRATLTA